MQRVTNSLIYHEGQILMLKKPRRGWWYAPGGKMDPGESVLEAVVRETKEETNLDIIQPQLKGVFTILIQENEQLIDEWMLFTFLSHEWKGTPYSDTREGELCWQPIAIVPDLPMPEGDRIVIRRIFTEQFDTLYGRFTYTPEYKLLDYKVDLGR